MKRVVCFLIAVGASCSQTALAGPIGQVEFASSEIRQHARDAQGIARDAADCAQADLDRQQKFFSEHKIAAFYGDNSAFGKSSLAAKRAALKRLGADPAIVSQLEPTSCIGLALKCLGSGFEKNGEAEVWARIRDYVKLNGQVGDVLQAALQKLGWKILYWNPDVRQSKIWDAQERKTHSAREHFWGDHALNYLNASGPGHFYLYNRVDDATLLVNFGRESPKALAGVPFFIGTANMGYHVFAGFYGKTIEAHSTRAIDDPKTVQGEAFNPLGGGGPTDGLYRSGLIAVPPGFVDLPEPTSR